MAGSKNKEGQYIVWTKSELLEEVCKVVGERCEYCFICKIYFFVLNQFQNQDLTHKFLNNLWCVYIDKNIYNNKIEQIFVTHD